MPVIDLVERGARPKTAFVLGGGGNLGAIQVGMLRALISRGIEPDLIVGSSVGALNAAAIAGAPTSAGVGRLAEVWIGLRPDDIFPTGRLTGPWMLLRRALSLCANDRLRGVIERCATFDRFEDAEVQVEVVATSLRTGREHWFGSGPIIEPILASAALPAVLPPVEIDGEMFIDGAVVDNVPISRALHHGCERIYVLHVGNFDRPRPRPRRPIDVLLQSFSIARNYRFLAEASAAAPQGVEIFTLPGIDPGGLKRDDFSRTRELIERASQVSGAYLDDRQRAIAGV
ncbi:MAG: patatin-like phospholipase family protein [Acidimicrobiales bacterium]